MGEEKDPLEQVETKEEVADPLEQVETKEEAPDPLGQAEAKEEPQTKAPDTNVVLAAALEKLTGALGRPQQQTPEQQEAAWQQLEAQTGKTRSQIVADDQRARVIALMANLETNKELGRMKVEKIVGDDPEVIEAVEKEMAGCPLEVQANPNAWLDAGYLVLGRSGKVAKKTASTGGTAPQRRIITGGSAQTTKSSATTKKEPAKTYTPMEQHVILRQFGGKSEEYEKAKLVTFADTGVKFKAESGSNNADKELERLTADNS